MTWANQRLLVYAVLTATLIGVLWFNQHEGLKSLATQTHTALCTFKQDLARREHDTRQFLTDLKAGRRKPIVGISMADWQRSINNQRATLDSLESLHCK